MTKYSAFSLVLNAFGGHKDWKKVWRNPQPKASYDVIIIGGGGHGLATAYYLAKEYGIRNIAVLEKGGLGSGNIGRNTTIVRSNYMLAPNTRFYEYSMKLWEGLSRELNYNMMFSQRGVLNLAHSPAQLDAYARRGNAMLMEGADAELFNAKEVRKKVPGLYTGKNTRFPILGGLFQPRAGTARHDAVAWGYARAADNYGVDIIEQCEVTGFIKEGGVVIGLNTTRGDILSPKVGVSVAGSTSNVMKLAGIDKLPIEAHVLQAFVSEPLKPLINTVVTFGAGHLYISQSDKGGLVFGGDLDGYNSYAQRGHLPTFEHVAAAAVTMFPNLARLRLLRNWGGIVDMSMDGSPIMCKGPLPGLYLNAGWCYGGFKATPAAGWCFAHTIARDKPHPLNEKFTLSRFQNGRELDEKGVGPHPGHQ